MKPLRSLSIDNVLTVVAAMLGEEYVANLAHKKLNNTKHGFSIYIDIKDRVHVNGSVYFRDSYKTIVHIDSYPYLKDHAENKFSSTISISVDRTCADLITEILNRFLPSYEPVMLKLKEKVEQINLKHTETLAAYKNICHEASYYLDPEKVTDPITSFTIPRRGISFKLNSDLNKVNLELKDIDIDRCKEILNLITKI